MIRLLSLGHWRGRPGSNPRQPEVLQPLFLLPVADSDSRADVGAGHPHQKATVAAHQGRQTRSATQDTPQAAPTSQPQAPQVPAATPPPQLTPCSPSGPPRCPPRRSPPLLVDPHLLTSPLGC